MSADSQNAPIPENLSLEKLSPELMTQVSEALAYTVIPLCADGQQLGSGVLVEVDGVSGILTAEHVIFDERFQRATGLWTTPHLHSEEARDKPTTHFTSTNIRMDLIRCYPEKPQRDSPEWGPDLGFIRIPELTNFEKSLRAVRNFYFVGSGSRCPNANLERAGYDSCGNWSARRNEPSFTDADRPSRHSPAHRISGGRVRT